MSKKTLILDCNDILFSTQYMYLLNIEKAVNADETRTVEADFKTILAKVKLNERSLFQSLLRRNIENIVDRNEFLDIMKFAEYKKVLEEGIQLHSPFSKYMMNLHKMTIETNIICVYDNEFEEFMLKARLEELEKDIIKIMSREELMQWLDSTTINRDDCALFTSSETLVCKYKDRIDIMIPDTLQYLKKHHKDANVYPIVGLWSHIK